MFPSLDILQYSRAVWESKFDSKSCYENPDWDFIQINWIFKIMSQISLYYSCYTFNSYLSKDNLRYVSTSTDDKIKRFV